MGIEDKLNRIVRQLERRIDEVSERVSRLEEQVNEFVEPLEFIAALADIMSSIRSVYVFNRLYYIISTIEPKRFPHEGVYKKIFENIEYAFSLIKNFHAEYGSNFPFIKEHCKKFSSILIDLAYLCDIRFDDLTVMIFRTLGKELASEIIDENVILKNYGSEEVIKWKKLLS